MNALTTPAAIKDEVWTAEGEGHIRLTRTPGAYDTDSPLFFGNSPAIRERAQRFADCVTAFVGVEDPVAELSRLRQIEARWNAITEAPARTVALLGEGVGSVLPDHEAARVAATYQDVQRGPAPWIVVDCWPGPLLYLTASKTWEGVVDKAGIFLVYEDALDFAEEMGAEVVALEWVQGQGGKN